MTQKENVLNFLKNNNGIAKYSDLSKLQINKATIFRLINEGLLERVHRGLYIDSNIIEDEYYTFQYKCPKAIFSHETALYFHDLSDRTPITFMVTVPSNYNTRQLKDKRYKFSYIKEELYEIGIIKIKTQFNNEVNCYDIERTICDIVRNKEKIETSLFTEAMKRYTLRKVNDYGKLYKYAEQFGVLNEVRKYIEVLK